MARQAILTFHFFITLCAFACFMAYFCLPALHGLGSWRQGPQTGPSGSLQPPGVGSASAQPPAESSV